MPDRPAELPRLEALRGHPVIRAAVRAAGSRPCHLVGGQLRDALLGRESHDFDLVVAGGGEEIARGLARRLAARFVPLGGKTFAAFRLVGSDFVVDLWDRADMSLEEDLARRDFTVNALALDLTDPRSEVIDSCGGLDDLAARRLRVTTPRVLAEDSLRVLRLARLVAELPGFAADPATVDSARAVAHRLPAVAAERIREELGRLLAAEGASRAVEILGALGLYPGLFLGRPGEVGEGDLERTAAAARRLAALAPAAARLGPAEGGPGAPSALAPARLALLLEAVPGVPPEEAAGQLAERGYVGRGPLQAALRLLQGSTLPVTDRDRRRFLHYHRQAWPAALALIAARDGETPEWITAVAASAALAAEQGPQLFDPPKLITGDEVRELLGLSPGPTLGKVMEALREAQVEGEIRTREEAVAWVRRRAG